MTLGAENTDDIAALTDDATPVGLLLSEESEDVLNALVAAIGGALVESKIAQVRYAPSKSCVVQYSTRVDWGDSTSKETFVAAFGIDVPGEVALIEVDGFPVSVWRYPNDPYLPGLEAAADPTRVLRLLSDLGSSQKRVNLRRRAFRPGRRAVIEAVSPSARLFIKVVQPSKIADIQRRHERFSGLAPIPISHGWSADLGLIVLEARKGKPLRAALESGSRNFPAPTDIVALLRRLQTGSDDWVQARSPVTSAPRHAHLLKTLLPHMSDTLESVVGSIEAVEDESPVWIHGDFHSSQVLVRRGTITGLVDIDVAGYGQPGDDLASLLGQLTTIALRSRRRRTVENYRQTLLAHFDTITDPKSLRLRTAAVILGLATGPFRVQRKTWPTELEQRIQLANQWVESSRRYD